MNLRRRLLSFHQPALRNAPKSSVWSSHLPPPVRTVRFHPPDRPATAKTNKALRVTKGEEDARFPEAVHLAVPQKIQSASNDAQLEEILHNIKATKTSAVINYGASWYGLIFILFVCCNGKLCGLFLGIGSYCLSDL
ncbi:hypothetical protein KSP40_PGU009229 [Platanthera guangdongensis]|uniref:Uncharacterized protein n=1 Tax=Platanthera guangdongensis TaxID=2320717 RepID=A0ABR2M6P8_9ASPA